VKAKALLDGWAQDVNGDGLRVPDGSPQVRATSARFSIKSAELIKEHLRADARRRSSHRLRRQRRRRREITQ
jgi:hypothetical protein